MDVRRVLESNHSGSVLEGDHSKEEIIMESIECEANYAEAVSSQHENKDDMNGEAKVMRTETLDLKKAPTTSVDYISAGCFEDVWDMNFDLNIDLPTNVENSHRQALHSESNMAEIKDIEQSLAAVFDALDNDANIDLQSSEGLHTSPTDNHVGVSSNQDHIMEVEEEHHEQQVDACNDQDLKVSDEKIVEQMSPRSESSSCEFHSRYFMPPINEGEYSVNDLVWGKVKRNLWWPGQIFNPANASVKAMKHYKNDCFLVRYFGNCTFAWNDSTRIRPFRTHLSLIEEQITTEAFHQAVRCALVEVSRQVESGLACSCIPKKFLTDTESQIIENIGVRRDVGGRYVAVESTAASCFEPKELLEHVKLLALSPSASNDDELHLTISKAQLTSFSRFRERPEFHLYEGLMEDQSECGANNRRSKRICKFAHRMPPKKKGRHMLELIPVQNLSSIDEMLSQLHLVAQDPMKECGCLNNMTTFFSSFRQSLGTRQKNQPTERRGGKKKAPQSIIHSPGEFEFHYLNDSNERDRTIQNYGEEQPLDTVQSGRAENELVHYVADKHKKSRGRPRKHFSGKHIMVAEEPVVENVDNGKPDCSPTVLVLKFPEGKFVPSALNLHKLFRRFGPLREDETEVDTETNQAKLIYKRSCDAEVAFSSAGIFIIFEPMVVNYELTFVETLPFKTSQVAIITRPGG